MAGTPVLNLGPDELLTTTRSVRKRLDLDRPVPLEIVQECLEIALQAPSASNMQYWHFVVVTDPGDRATIGDYYLRSHTDYLAGKQAAGNPYADDPERTATHARIKDSSTHLAEVMGRVPVLVIPCIDAGTEALPAENQSALWGSVLPAAWSYLLAARARGLGVGRMPGCPTDVGGVSEAAPRRVTPTGTPRPETSPEPGPLPDRPRLLRPRAGDEHSYPEVAVKAGEERATDQADVRSQQDRQTRPPSGPATRSRRHFSGRSRALGLRRGVRVGTQFRGSGQRVAAGACA